jgi:hypothetical protein
LAEHLITYFDLTHDSKRQLEIQFTYAYAVAGAVHGHQFQVSGTNALLIDSSGRVGIGTTSPGYKLDVTGGGIVKLNGLNGYDLLVSNTQDSGTLYDFNIGSGSGAFSFTTSAGERARIDSSGRLLVGTPSARAGFFGDGAVVPNIQLEVSGSRSRQAWITNANDGQAPEIIILPSHAEHLTVA